MGQMKEVLFHAAASLYPEDDAKQDEFMRAVVDGKLYPAAITNELCMELANHSHVWSDQSMDLLRSIVNYQLSQ